MTQPCPPLDDSLRHLFDAAVSNTLSDEQFDRLEAELSASEETRRHYLRYCTLEGDLRYLTSMDHADEMTRLRHSSDLEPCPVTPSIITDAPTIETSFFGGSLFSYSMATIALSMVLLILGMWNITAYRKGGDSLQVPGRLTAGINATQVGSISKVADCRGRRWSVASGQWLEIKNHDFHLGDRFVLSSGLLEIAYDSGAKVILQGPCTYRIDSDRSGFLAVGKLTAKVEKGPGVRGPGSGNANHSPLFAVRTPTAVVTDLGTEFGVEVEQSGATRSHVFQGKVELRENSRELTTPGASPLILQAGESARVKRGRNNIVAITRESGQSGRFVRQIHQGDIGKGRGERTANYQSESIHQKSSHSSPTRISPEAYAKFILSLNPVAYYRMDRTDLEDEKGRIGVFDSSPGGHHGVFRSKDESFMPYTAGLFGNAMTFRGSSMNDCVLVRGIPDPQDHQLTLAAWVKADAMVEHPLIVLRLGFYRNDGQVANGFRFGVPGTLSLHRWHHVAYVVHDISGKATTSAYLNGKCVRHNPFSDAWFKLSRGYWCIGGPDSAMDITEKSKRNNWQGQIDEFAIFNKALSSETIEQLYLGGEPADGVVWPAPTHRTDKTPVTKKKGA